MEYFIWKSYKLKIDPFSIFEELSDRPYCFFLDSQLNCANSGRYSFLGANPYSVVKTKGREPFTLIRRHFKECNIAFPRGVPPFIGGAVGFLAYELGFALEKTIKHKPKKDIGLSDALFGFFNTVIIIDHLKNNLHICAVGFPEKRSYLARALAQENFKKIHDLISRVQDRKNIQQQFSLPSSELRSNFTKQQYLKAVKQAKHYIRRGDIYQVNLSQRFHSKTELSGFDIYRRLRRNNAASFNAYFNAQEAEILSSSPERFLKLNERFVLTKPMKGTRPRGLRPAQDSSLRKELLNSPKDKAELLMIVDLERNDLGRVCDYGSIEVPVLRELEKYKTVYQTTSTVQGKLYKDKDALDLLEACFPGGSITGCPKIRAMEIIDELEPDRRLIYTGSLGYLSFSGNMDFNILIRTILKKGKDVYIGAGGGIVADSVPEAEFEETLIKARGMFEALRGRQDEKNL